MKLDGRKAVVTGAGRGIGRAIAAKLAALGARVAVADVDGDAAEQVAREIEDMGGRAMGVALDVTDADAVTSAMKKIAADFDGIDILVNNAGITRDGLIARMSPGDWQMVLDVNLTGAFNCIRAVSRTMMSQRYGRIVNISSIIGQIGNAGQANYAASKAGIVALTRSVAKELASRGVTANAVAPGFIETGMTADLPEKVKEQYLSTILLRRFGKAEDVANVVAFLVCDEGDYVNGQTINVDGGMI
ncbi:MAG: 3-oxoacyl-[acyl-carrier-protein] reductase [Candidatus Eisenbacteria bacterium]|nr:3-oxoacyl-[acyl-carrier-protein] reductase [Candidatus Eisenbacteria bacterium]